ncbi:MAG: hypothetical protein JWO02_4661 [Solirubrobacterales bacterium]|nr:hypothetical protein [Solirubrobacterales bacterium]
MIRVAVLVLAAVAAVFALSGPAGQAGAASTVTLRLDGIGPLKLGMSRAAAVKTGWLSNRGTGCPLGGPPLPISYRLKGAAAPKGVSGSAEFNGGKLTDLSFTKGVRTATGVVLGTTTTAQMVSMYRNAGYKAKSAYSDVFGGTFVDVSKASRRVIGGFGPGKIVTTLAIPGVSVCD